MYVSVVRRSMSATNAWSWDQPHDVCNGLRVGDRVRYHDVKVGKLTEIDYNTGICQFQRHWRTATETVLYTSVGRREHPNGAGEFLAFDGPLDSFAEFACVGDTVLCETAVYGKILSIDGETGKCKIQNPDNPFIPPSVRRCSDVSVVAQNPQTDI